MCFFNVIDLFLADVWEMFSEFFYPQKLKKTKKEVDK